MSLQSWRKEEAIVSYERALEFNPRDAGVWNNKGNALWSLACNAEATEAYRQFVHHAPSGYESYVQEVKQRIAQLEEMTTGN